MSQLATPLSLSLVIICLNRYIAVSGFKKSLLPGAISMAMVMMVNANASNDNQFLDDAHLNGKLRTVYYNVEDIYDKSQGKKPYRAGAWTGALHVNLQSGYLGDFLAIGGSAYGVVKLRMDKNKFSNAYQLLDENNDGFAKLGQLWADLKFSNDDHLPAEQQFSGHVKIGRQLLYNGLISSSGSRSVPSTWQGINFNGTVNNLKLGLAWVDKMSLRNEDNFNDLVNFNDGNPGRIDYIIGGEITYTFNLADDSNLTLKYRNAFSKDFLQAHNGDLSWEKPLGDALELELGAKYYRTKKDGDLWNGSAWYKPAFDDNATAVNLNGSLSFMAWRFYGAVSKFRARTSQRKYSSAGFAPPGVYYYDFGKNTHGIWDLPTSAFAEDMIYDNETVWMLGLDYSFEALGAQGLTMGYAYHYGSGMEVTEKNTGRKKSVAENEHDIHVNYAFPEPLKGLKFKLEYGRYRNDLALRQAVSKEENDLRIWLDYNFTIF